MSKTKSMLLAVILGVVASCANALTIDELVSAQRDAMGKEASRKAEGDHPAPAAPVAQPSQAIGTKTSPTAADMRLVGVFGKGDKWTADIAFNGVTLTVRPGGEVLDGWAVEKISASRVVLRSKTNGRQTLYLSEPATNTTTSVPSMGGQAGMPGFMGANLPPLQSVR
ncbi:type IV pilus biogenesis protein PilP [Herbaspirillum seropedicae]|uniref:type IV pilus biogenesis protein PilP n=1 Tax=Herbaspirillum seropedicae TaxID=964 RepID=UPI00285EF214|nr:type IV pilus biogenesis protein PilP [Herbaspirillum seropedicae]MDR6398062.1 type IV pilus biogenesis protein PilP [Herbaspirillum seropedicae]